MASAEAPIQRAELEAVEERLGKVAFEPPAPPPRGPGCLAPWRSLGGAFRAIRARAMPRREPPPGAGP